MYTAIKHIHMLCALLSITGFLLRAVWTFQQSPLLQKKVTKVLPHLIDTVFLGSAFTLAWLSSQYPFYAPWLLTTGLAGPSVILVLLIRLGSKKLGLFISPGLGFTPGCPKISLTETKE